MAAPFSNLTCRSGHPRTPENTYVNPNKPAQRMCRVCNRIAKAYRVAKAARRAERMICHPIDQHLETNP